MVVGTAPGSKISFGICSKMMRELFPHLPTVKHRGLKTVRDQQSCHAPSPDGDADAWSSWVKVKPPVSTKSKHHTITTMVHLPLFSSWEGVSSSTAATLQDFWLAFEAARALGETQQTWDYSWGTFNFPGVVDIMCIQYLSDIYRFVMSDNGWHPQIKSIVVVIIIIITTITIITITITITITIILEWWAMSRATFGRNPMDSKSGHVKFLRSSIGLWVVLGWLFWKVDFHASGQMISISVQYPGTPWLLMAWDPHQSRPSESISPAQWMCTDWQLATWRNCLASGGNSNGYKNHQKFDMNQ